VIGPTPQSPIPNPQSPIPQSPELNLFLVYIKYIRINKIFLNLKKFKK